MTIRKASRVLVYGVLSLSIVSIVSRIFSAFTTIILARFLGPDDYGLWGLTMSSIGLFSLVDSIPGTGSAVIKFVSQYDAEEEPGQIRKITILGLKVKTILGLVLGASAFILAPFIAEHLMHYPELTTLIRISVIYYIAINVGFIDCIFKGLKKFHMVALFDVIERILFFVFIALVLFAGFGLTGVAIGNAATYVTLTIITLVVVFIRYVPRSSHSSGEVNGTGLFKKMLAYGVPASVGDLINNFYNNFLTLYLGIWVGAASVGLLGAARSALSFLFLTPMSFVATVLFPLSSEMYAKKQIEHLRRFLSLLSKYTLYFTCYLSTFTLFFASELTVLIYSTEYEASAFYFQILIFLAIAAVWTSLAGNVLLGAGYSKVTLKLSAIYVISGTVLALFVVPLFGVLGACLLLVFLQLFVSLPLYIIYAKRIVGNFLAPRAYVKSIPAILVSLAFMFFIKSFFAFQLSGLILSLLVLLVIFSIGALVFSVVLCLTGAVKKTEISSLSEILSTSPVASLMKPLTFLLRLFSKFARS
jgi:O-antigen/teichoic acid export membrane protein